MSPSKYTTKHITIAKLAVIYTIFHTLFYIAGCTPEKRNPEPDAFILPIWDRCLDPIWETPDGTRLHRPGHRNVEFHKGCRKRYTEEHCAVRIIEYAPDAHGVICGIRATRK